MELTKYPDGTSYVSLDPQGREGNTIFRINSYEDLWHLGQFVEAYNFSLGKPLITIPNLIDAQADKRFEDNQSSGLKLVCKFLNDMNADFRIFHPHNPEVVEASMSNVKIIDNSEFIGDVLTKLFLKDGNEELILMSSDAGGFKPLSKLCDKLDWKGEMYSASKARSWDEVDGTKFVQQIDREDFQGKDILIVDDISVYGGTFKGLSKLLKQRNCGKLFLAVSHMTVENLGTDPVTNYFDKVFTTNSKYDYYASLENGNIGNQPKNLEIIKLF